MVYEPKKKLIAGEKLNLMELGKANKNGTVYSPDLYSNTLNPAGEIPVSESHHLKLGDVNFGKISELLLDSFAVKELRVAGNALTEQDLIDMIEKIGKTRPAPDYVVPASARQAETLARGGGVSAISTTPPSQGFAKLDQLVGTAAGIEPGFHMTGHDVAHSFKERYGVAVTSPKATASMGTLTGADELVVEKNRKPGMIEVTKEHFLLQIQSVPGVLDAQVPFDSGEEMMMSIQLAGFVETEGWGRTIHWVRDLIKELRPEGYKKVDFTIRIKEEVTYADGRTGSGTETGPDEGEL